MYGTTAISHRALDDLSASAGGAAIDELRALARPIEGLRVLNLSVTAFGTSTAELLNSSVPLLTDLGLDCHWQVVRASEENMHANRSMYQALGGTHLEWTREMTDAWQRYAEMNAGLLTEPFDVIVVHDPQPAAIRSYVQDDAGAKWVLHSHLDLSSARKKSGSRCAPTSKATTPPSSSRSRSRAKIFRCAHISSSQRSTRIARATCRYRTTWCGPS